MSKPGDNPADPFKKALAEATKVMANNAIAMEGHHVVRGLAT